MNTTLENYITKFDDCLNAILVKELRQTVRGKFFWSIFLLYLVVICLILFFALNEASRFNRFNGDAVASFLLIALYFIAGLLVPIKIGKKTSSEMGDATNELLYTTTMSSKSIVTGKFLCGSVIILMLYSAIVPFISLTLFMGGVDLRLLFILLIYSFLLSNLAVIWHIFIALWAGANSGESSNVANTVAGSIAHFICWIGSITFANGVIIEYSSSSKITSLLVYAVVFLIAYIFAGGLLFATSISKLEPETSNKMYGIRVAASVAWLIGTVITAFFEFEIVITWTVIVFIVLMLLSLILYSEPDLYSNRIIEDIPNSMLERFFKFPFFTGVTNGICWIMITSFLTIIASFICSIIHYKHGSDFVKFVMVMFTFLFHVNAHGLIMNFVRNTFMDGKTKQGVGQMAFTSFIIVNIVSLVVYNMFFRNSDFMENVFALICPFFAFDMYRHGSVVVIIGGIGFFILGLMLNIKNIIGQFNAYFNKGYD